MAVEKFLGKISKARLGTGGYQDAMFGLRIDFSLNGGSGCSDFHGYWTDYPNKASYSKEQFEAQHANAYRFVRNIMNEAKVNDFTKLIGIPVEVTFDGQTMKSWRVLKEVL